MAIPKPGYPKNQGMSGMKRFLSYLSLPVVLFSLCSSTWAQDASTVSLSLPDIQWSLNVALPGFELKQKELAQNGEATRFLADNPDSGVIISAFLEKAPHSGDSKECRSYYWERAKDSPLKKVGIRKYELSDFAVVEFFVPEYQGMEVNQKNINAYLAVDGYWIDIHISKTNYQDSDETYFRSILDNVSIDRNYTPSAYENFTYGNLFYQQHQYKRAIPFYEKSLAQEKRHATLDRDYFKVLLDLLGISYGVSGDLEKSKEVLQWAITQEPEYPLFYYNLACAHAELDNMPAAIANLRKAYQYRNNVLEGETLPDPTADSSFSRFMTNKTFMEELNKMRNMP